MPIERDLSALDDLSKQDLKGWKHFAFAMTGSDIGTLTITDTFDAQGRQNKTYLSRHP